MLPADKCNNLYKVSKNTISKLQNRKIVPKF